MPENNVLFTNIRKLSEVFPFSTNSQIQQEEQYRHVQKGYKEKNSYMIVFILQHFLIEEQVCLRVEYP